MSATARVRPVIEIDITGKLDALTDSGVTLRVSVENGEVRAQTTVMADVFDTGTP